MRKKIDQRIRDLLQRCSVTRHRSMFVIIGDCARDQIGNLHYILSTLHPGKKPSVLWCYSQDLGFSSHAKKRMKILKKKLRNNTCDPDMENAFELFLTSTSIRFCYYKETVNILGQTFQMCILQDFEALTPDILCRTIETIEGGGVLCILLKTMSSLRRLYNVTMDVHASYISNYSELKSHVQPRFNKRLILSLSECENCLIVDDELTVLPLNAARMRKTQDAEEKVLVGQNRQNTSSHCSDPTFQAESDTAHPPLSDLDNKSQEVTENDTVQILTNMAITEDQKRCIQTCCQYISSHAVNATVALTAGRGRGKSAALGLLLAEAVSCGYRDIYVTAPSPENLKTLFSFCIQGLNRLGYEQHKDYELIEASYDLKHMSEKLMCLVRINIHKDGLRQTIQYIVPQDYLYVNRQAELVVIDEAAAIPLNIVSKFFQSYLTIVSSTVHGYEGTGRSLSLKLLKKNPSSSRGLFKLTLKQPIRYSNNDPLERWLHHLLCLNATEICNLQQKTHLPPLSHCCLYLVDRDALFSYHTMAEGFLNSIMSLFVSSHYKNSPNDLMLLSDAPAQYIFVLLPELDLVQASCAPSDTNNLTFKIPDILCAIHVTLEGSIKSDLAIQALMKGVSPAGDLIPWLLTQNFRQEENLTLLNGARIVRIAVHPALQHMGYGSEALKQLEQALPKMYHSLVSQLSRKPLTAHQPEMQADPVTTTSVTNLPPLLTLCETGESSHSNGIQTSEDLNLDADDALNEDTLNVSHEQLQLHYIGTCFGLTEDLFRFYRRLDFYPLYISQHQNETTLEHSALLIKALTSNDLVHQDWVLQLYRDFQNRFINMVSITYKNFSTKLILSLLTCEPPGIGCHSDAEQISFHLKPIDSNTIYHFFSPHSLLRMEHFNEQLIEKSQVMDLIPQLARLVFSHSIPHNDLSLLQKALLCAMGCQFRSGKEFAEEFSITEGQVSILFSQALRKCHESLTKLIRSAPEKCDSLVIQPEVAKSENPTWEKSMRDHTQEMAQNIEADSDDSEVNKRAHLKTKNHRKHGFKQSRGKMVLRNPDGLCAFSSLGFKMIKRQKVAAF